MPTSRRIYGVKVGAINEILKQCKDPSFELTEALWKSAAFEERLLATKMLGRVCRKDSARTLRLVETFASEANDWVVCDTLATQGVRGIVNERQAELLKLSGQLIKSPNFWERRFALVLLTNYAKSMKFRELILQTMRIVENDEEHYVRKAIEWLRRDLAKGG